jgi:hypothetical protein
MRKGKPNSSTCSIFSFHFRLDIPPGRKYNHRRRNYLPHPVVDGKEKGDINSLEVIKVVVYLDAS